MTARRPDGMLINPPTVRQYMGCAYEPKNPNIPVAPWDGTELGRVLQSDEVDDRGKVLLPVCAGYVCTLPEVVEASRAHAFFRHGGLLQWTDGEPPTPATKQAVLELESEYGRVMEWSSKNPPKS